MNDRYRDRFWGLGSFTVVADFIVLIMTIGWAISFVFCSKAMGILIR